MALESSGRTLDFSDAAGRDVLVISAFRRDLDLEFAAIPIVLETCPAAD
jgi:hypothetical protein